MSCPKERVGLKPWRVVASEHLCIWGTFGVSGHGICERRGAGNQRLSLTIKLTTTGLLGLVRLLWVGLLL